MATRSGVHLTKLGRVDKGVGLRIREGGRVGLLANFDNERFSEGSQFTAGMSAYRERLLGSRLIL